MSIYEYDEAKYTKLVREEGKIAGAALMAELTKRLLDDGRLDDLREAAENPVKREALLAEFGME